MFRSAAHLAFVVRVEGGPLLDFVAELAPVRGRVPAMKEKYNAGKGRLNLETSVDRCKA